MAVCRCLTWPNPCFGIASGLVEAITEDICAIWQDMVSVATLIQGVELPTTKSNVMLRLAVIYALQTRGYINYLANPEILQSFMEHYEFQEVSPNLLGVSIRISLPESVFVRFMNEQGIIDRREFTYLWTKPVHHQIDHLNGKMYFDNLFHLHWSMLLKKARPAK